MRVMPSLFELVYSGENAFHITVTNFYTIDFTCTPEIQSILGFKSSVLEKGLDNLRRYFLSSMYNQVMGQMVPNLTSSQCILVITHISSSSRQWATKWWRCFPSYLCWLKKSMCNSMFKKKGGTLIVKVSTKRWMVLVELQGSNCLYPYIFCVWSIPWRLCLIWVD